MTRGARRLVRSRTTCVATSAGAFRHNMIPCAFGGDRVREWAIWRQATEQWQGRRCCRCLAPR